MQRWIGAAIFLLSSGNAVAQPTIAPTRNYGANPTAGTPGIAPTRTPGMTNMLTGMTPTAKPKTGFQDLPLVAVPTNPSNTGPSASVNSTDADPLTLSHPGQGKLTDFYDPPPNSPEAGQSLPGQRSEILPNQ